MGCTWTLSALGSLHGVHLDIECTRISAWSALGSLHGVHLDIECARISAWSALGQS